MPIHNQLAHWLPKPPINWSYFLCAAPSHRYPDGKHHVNPRDLNEKLQVIAKKLGFSVGRKVNGIVFHSLRRFFETASVDSGVPQFVVDQWMGNVGQGKSMGSHYYGHNAMKHRAYMAQVRFFPEADESSPAIPQETVS